MIWELVLDFKYPGGLESQIYVLHPQVWKRSSVLNVLPILSQERTSWAKKLWLSRQNTILFDFQSPKLLRSLGMARRGLDWEHECKTGRMGQWWAKLCTPIGGQMAGLPAGQVGGRQACESLWKLESQFSTSAYITGIQNLDFYIIKENISYFEIKFDINSRNFLNS